MFYSNKRKSEAEEISTANNIIGKGTVIEGDINATANIRIEGKVMGNIKTKAKLALGPGSYVKGNIIAQNAEIAGTIEGRIEVVDLLILKSNSVILGDVAVTKLAVESGAQFNGSCKMIGEIKQVASTALKEVDA